jgi:hypothetical protein
MPRAGSGFTTRCAPGNRSRSNSLSMAESPAAQTTTTWSAGNRDQSSIWCPSTVLSPHGKSIFGRPMREDRPAARITAASEKFSSVDIAINRSASLRPSALSIAINRSASLRPGALSIAINRSADLRSGALSIAINRSAGLRPGALSIAINRSAGLRPGALTKESKQAGIRGAKSTCSFSPTQARRARFGCGAGPEAGAPKLAGHFNLPNAPLTASKFGRSLGVGVFSLYWMTPCLSMTNAARAAVSPTPASIGNTTS